MDANRQWTCSNWKWLLVSLLALTVDCASRNFNGGRVYSDLTLEYEDSPFIIEDDVIVDENAVLTVEAGVEMRFSPQTMMAVNGTLRAIVSDLPI